jgi:hypothetical protein
MLAWISDHQTIVTTHREAKNRSEEAHGEAAGEGQRTAAPPSQ